MHSWQLLSIAVISYIVFLLCTSLTVWIAFRNGFSSIETENGVKGGSLTLFILSVFTPIIYIVMTYIYIIKLDANIPTKSTFIIMVITYILMMITASFGIWETNTNENWKSNNEEFATNITFIVILVLSLFLPFFYGLFYYRQIICRDKLIL